MTTPNNLPAELTSFVGREPQLAELRRLLHRSRLLTLTGPGGAGKTRLALRLATLVLDRFPDGVWLVELASVADPKLLEQTVASSCGIREEKNRSVAEALIGSLADRRSLLILDSTEHLVDACAMLAGQILRACRTVTLLVTGREPLGVSGEIIWRTPSLTVPRTEDAEHPELLLQSEAVRLFVERASLSRPGFDFDRSAAVAVAAVTSRLEGIPLAVELAAGLTATMTLPDIVDGLKDRFRLLTGGSRSALPRHQTLRQAVDWSYRLLSPEEQGLFATLATFGGGFDLSAVEAVAGAASTRDDVRSLLQRLVSKSLVMSDPSRLGRTRYEMLETIREYALEKLHEQGDAELRGRHAEYYVEWSAEAVQHLSSHDQRQWLDRFDQELANVRMALEWTIAENPEAALGLASSLAQYKIMRGLFLEGLDWLDRALANVTGDSAARASALRTRARIQRRRGNIKAAQRDAETAAQICRSIGDDAQLARALTLLGIVASSNRHWAKAERFHRQALELSRRVHSQRGVAASLSNLGLLALGRGKADVALRLVDEGLANMVACGDRFTQSSILASRAAALFALGQFDSSEATYLDSIRLAAEFEDVETTAEACDGLAVLTVSRRNPRRALTLFGAAAGLRNRYGTEAPMENRDTIARAFTEARAQLGKQAADTAWKEGESRSFRQVIDLVMGSPARSDSDGHSPLSLREAEVARLIAAGLTNAEVAGKLRISDRTVDAHVEHIRNKLGLRTRSQIAVWAHERLGNK